MSSLSALRALRGSPALCSEMRRNRKAIPSRGSGQRAPGPSLRALRALRGSPAPFPPGDKKESELARLALSFGLSTRTCAFIRSFPAYAGTGGGVSGGGVTGVAGSSASRLGSA